ncbi:thioredoxin [Candidatus Dependentiae bacterium]|nr:thioredoxin [Candidatus Dependentiae bacterium]
MVQDITNNTFKKEVLESTKPVIIDAYASWCGPCQHMSPIFEEVANALGDSCTFFKLNVDEERELAAHLSIASIPTFLFFKNGVLASTESGYLSKADFEGKVTKLVKS